MTLRDLSGKGCQDTVYSGNLYRVHTKDRHLRPVCHPDTVGAVRGPTECLGTFSVRGPEANFVTGLGYTADILRSS